MTQETHDHRRFNTPAAILWASAFLLGALVIIQASQLPGNRAYAEMGVAIEDYTVITVDSGRGKDEAPNELLYILDNRAEVLLVYEIEDARRKQIELRDGGSLRALFAHGSGR